MAIQFTDSFALELMSAIHDFTADTFKMALFTSTAALGSSTTAYSATNEVANGNGYTTGGATMSVGTALNMTSHVANIRFSDVSWTFSANTALQYALVYNSSKSNRSVLVIDIGGSRTVTGSFQITFPLTLDPLITIRVPVLS